MPLAVHLSYTPADDHLAHLRAALRDDIGLTHGPDLPDPPDYQVLVAGRPSQAMLTASPHLHSLVIPFAGVPAITQERLREHPHIAIYNLHHNATSAAEYAVALLLAAAKNLVAADQVFRQHDWRPRHDPMPAFILRGQTVLILGYGAIGERVATVCRALGMRVMGVKRTLDPHANYPDEMHTLAALPHLLPKARAVVICLPGTPHTEGLIGADELALLPVGAVLINVGRAAVVDQDALYDALKTRHLQAAGFDVWYSYPASVEDRPHHPPAKAPFHTLDNMVMSPHRAGGVGTGEIEAARMEALAETLNALARGQSPAHQVDLSAGY